MSDFYLPEGLPAPSAAPDGLSQPYWDGVKENKLRIQKCRGCGSWQWGPEWICHRCHSFDLAWEEIKGRGRIWSYQRPHHPVHSALNGHGPYLVVLVELPDYGNVRMIGNLLGDPRQEVRIGTPVEAVFEHHKDYSLVQWRVAG
jgi:uncharacterized OB-fold protein